MSKFIRQLTTTEVGGKSTTRRYEDYKETPRDAAAADDDVDLFFAISSSHSSAPPFNA